MSEPFRLRRWTRKEYHQLAQVGILLEDDPIELIDGQLIIAERKTPPHSVVVGLTANCLGATFGDGWYARQQAPIALDEHSEPEPDIAVVPGEPRDHFIEHPARPLLVVEIADTALSMDRHFKGSLYARASLPDYWIVNLVDRQVEVYRRPDTDPAADFGWRYLDVHIVAPGGDVTPLALPDTRIAVADLLP
jgi:Uma2 family endonuclease